METLGFFAFSLQIPIVYSAARGWWASRKYKIRIIWTIRSALNPVQFAQILVSFFGCDLYSTWTSGPYATFYNIKVFNIAEEEI